MAITEMNMRDWRGLFDAQLRCDYGITIDDSGLDDWTLWLWRESYPDDPAAAVRAYGEKYDLTLMRDALEGLA
jgi:hypothetical protein